MLFEKNRGWMPSEESTNKVPKVFNDPKDLNYIWRNS